MSAPAPTKIGRYELGPELGRGGMARVHLGRLVGAVGFARPVAIKSLHPGMANDASFVKMFIDEARLAAHVRHPNVVAVHDVVAEDGALYLVMEYVPGPTVDALIERDKHIPIPIALALVAGTLAGLHAAHEAHGEDGQPLQIVHRDVSPQNVIVGSDGVPKLLDFGVAKARSQMHSTATGELKGKLPYMSPEQITAKPLDGRSDVFSAGVMLWELLTGEGLFHRGEEAATIFAVMQGDVEAPSTRRSDVPPALDAIAMRCLAHDPEARYATAYEALLAIEALKLAASARETAAWVQAAIPTPVPEHVVALITGTLPAAAPPVARTRPSRRRGIFALAGIGLVGVGIAALALRRDPPAPAPALATIPAPVAAPPVLTPPPVQAPPPTATKPPVHAKHAVVREAKPKPKPECRITNPDGTVGYRPECLK